MANIQTIMMSPMNVVDRFDRATGFLHYPIDILNMTDRPIVKFTCMVPIQGYTDIYFPMPEGVQMNDSMAYNNQDLNILGYAAQRGARVGIGAESWTQAGAGLVGETGKILSEFIPGTRREALASLAQATNTNAEIAAGIASVNQMSQNKNTVTTFDGVGIRTHTFTFKMIARSPEESQMIKNIQFAFRAGMYPVNVPSAENMRLNFPPKWRIEYVSLPNLAPLTHLPQPYECYLQNLSTNFNASSKMWRSDKAPLEVDVTVAFTETKALTMRDIADMQGRFSADGVNMGESVGDDIMSNMKDRLGIARAADDLAQLPPGDGSLGTPNYAGNSSQNRIRSIVDRGFK
jgi:hypothetical protein